MVEIVTTRGEADQFGDLVVRFDATLGPIGARLVRRLPRLKAFFLFRCAATAKLIVIDNYDRATPLLLPLMLLRRRCRVVLLDFMRAPPRGRVKRRIWPYYNRYFLSPVMRRTVVAAHVLSEPERHRYAALYRLPLDRLFFIPFPLFRAHIPPVADPERVEGVVASGRALCDWDGIFAAAKGTTWPLTVICSKDDVAHVDRLNADQRATRYSELAVERHDRLVAGADVYVLAVQEAATSAGHVRLRTAIENLSPVVATDVQGLTGYIRAETARVVPSGDPSALRDAVEDLLASPEDRAILARRAFDWAARERNWDQYLATMREVFATLLRERQT
jgi:glycosyltransferase involved in cell wall biosynthesis